MKKNRRGSIEAAKKAQNWGVILGTLGRQGNPRILDLLEEKLKNSGMSCFVTVWNFVLRHC